MHPCGYIGVVSDDRRHTGIVLFYHIGHPKAKCLAWRLVWFRPVEIWVPSSQCKFMSSCSSMDLADGHWCFKCLVQLIFCLWLPRIKSLWNAFTLAATYLYSEVFGYCQSWLYCHNRYSGFKSSSAALTCIAKVVGYSNEVVIERVEITDCAVHRTFDCTNPYCHTGQPLYGNIQRPHCRSNGKRKILVQWRAILKSPKNMGFLSNAFLQWMGISYSITILDFQIAWNYFAHADYICKYSFRWLHILNFSEFKSLGSK